MQGKGKKTRESGVTGRGDFEKVFEFYALLVTLFLYVNGATNDERHRFTFVVSLWCLRRALFTFIICKTSGQTHSSGLFKQP